MTPDRNQAARSHVTTPEATATEAGPAAASESPEGQGSDLSLPNQLASGSPMVVDGEELSWQVRSADSECSQR